jgi:rubrerythrin
VTSCATRRDALRRAALAAGVLASPTLLRPKPARAQATDDEVELAAFLVEAIALEQIAVLAYESAADEEGLGAGLGQTLRRFAEHEQAHASALRSALDSIGVDSPDAPRGARDREAIEGIDRLDADRATELADLLGELAELDARGEYLDYLVGIEREQIELYVQATPEFGSEDLVRTGAEIAGCAAQHAVVLREALGAPPARSVADLSSAGN